MVLLPHHSPYHVLNLGFHVTLEMIPGDKHEKKEVKSGGGEESAVR